MRIARLTTAGLAGGALLALAAAPLAAGAHVSVTPNGTAAGTSSVLTFAFGHGCDGSPTTALTIDIPESIMAVSPTLHPNWTIEKVIEDDRIAQVVYTAITPVEEGYRDAIELAVRLPEGAAGDTLVFPVLQSCAEGEVNWNELAEEGAAEPERPAPTMVVTAATGAEHGGHGAESDDAADEADDETADAAATAGSEDVVARVLGIGGLVVGVVGIVLAITARRPRSDA